MNEFKSYIGLDTHKATIAVAVARAGREGPHFEGTIPNTKAAVAKLLGQVSAKGESVSFCYEAGPCGYDLYRMILAHGHECVVVAPSLIPRKPGDRLKTDRRDAMALAHLHRAGALTAVWVPGEEQEAMRDLTRAREDMKELLTRAQQRLGAFLLRHNQVYREGKSHWTRAHWLWLERVKMASPVQQIVLQEYIDTVRGRAAARHRLGARDGARLGALVVARDGRRFAGDARDPARDGDDDYGRVGRSHPL